MKARCRSPRRYRRAVRRTVASVLERQTQSVAARERKTISGPLVDAICAIEETIAAHALRDLLAVTTREGKAVELIGTVVAVILAGTTQATELHQACYAPSHTLAHTASRNPKNTRRAEHGKLRHRASFDVPSGINGREYAELPKFLRQVAGSARS